jgi:hypothetical protein
MQEITTETCGFYSIGLLIHLNNTKNKDIFKSAGQFINQFSYDSKNNNAILKEYFRNLPGSKGLKILSKLYSGCHLDPTLTVVNKSKYAMSI